MGIIKLQLSKGPILIFSIQVFVLGYVQFLHWSGENGYQQSNVLTEQISEQKLENEQLLFRNQALSREIEALKQENSTAIEGRARFDLGMINEGETFFLITE